MGSQDPLELPPRILGFRFAELLLWNNECHQKATSENVWSPSFLRMFPGLFGKGCPVWRSVIRKVLSTHQSSWKIETYTRED